VEGKIVDGKNGDIRNFCDGQEISFLHHERKEKVGAWEGCG
jgi:hypothetical protein